MTANTCSEAGCTGTIEDGYCNLCGTKAGAAAAAVSTPVATTGASSTAVLMSTRSARSGSASTRRTASTRSASTTRSRIGAGLVTVEPIPVSDPERALMQSPIVGEDKRFCAKCAEPVGRARAGRLARDAGFCGKCGHHFDFAPKLHAGDVVGGQYEVAGALAHGGLGWIYLARDRNVSNRWVVLKGLLDSGDADALAAAVAEQRFLATVEHPAIVKIYNVVQHDGAGYTVMEYVGGKSLKSILKDRREANANTPDPLPAEQAMAYMLELLPAFSYLHRLGLVYCDLKPDNLIQQGDNLKLIDLGGVRRLDDRDSAIYGTVGFQAPEIAELGPSVSSDLFTVARTLATLCIDFRGYQSQYKYTLPVPSDVAVFAELPSLYRFLLKGTAPHPDDRFQTAEEMGDQLLGVLHETVAFCTDTPAPRISAQFSGDRLTGRRGAQVAQRVDWSQLPLLKVDPSDSAASALANVAEDDPAEIAELVAMQPSTTEVKLRLVRAYLEAGEVAMCEPLLASVEQTDPWEWRVDWCRGLIALAGERYTDAAAAFERVTGEVPGELAPKLAMAVAAERAGDPGRARGLYEVVSRTDPAFVSAAFGLVRTLDAQGERAAAVAASNRVPETSTLYVEAQLAAAFALINPANGAVPTAQELEQASTMVTRLKLDVRQRAESRRDILLRSLELITNNRIRPTESTKVLGCPLLEAPLRKGIEQSYRDLARLATGRDERFALVDAANKIRPRTLV